MKRYLTALFTICSAAAWAQPDTAARNQMFTHAVYEIHSIQATASLGFIDAYRQDFTLSPGFEKNNTSGYANIAAKFDYGLNQNISLATNFGYDAFVYNFNQLYQGNNNTVIRRYKKSNVRILNVGIIAYYHLGKWISVKRLDPFVGLGLSLNNIRYNAYPQGDSTLVRIDHTVTRYIKVGARYYISDKFSLFADAGFEKQSIFSLGFSCRFFSKNSSIK